MREKSQKSGREKSKVPVKKSEKWPKKALTPTLGFHAPKKNTVPDKKVSLAISVMFWESRIRNFKDGGSSGTRF